MWSGVGLVFTGCNFISIKNIQTGFLKSTLPIFWNIFQYCVWICFCLIWPNYKLKNYCYINSCWTKIIFSMFHSFLGAMITSYLRVIPSSSNLDENNCWRKTFRVLKTALLIFQFPFRRYVTYQAFPKTILCQHLSNTLSMNQNFHQRKVENQKLALEIETFSCSKIR